MKDYRVRRGVERGKKFDIEVDGQRIAAYEGETVAAALLAAGKIITNHTPIKKERRGIYCGIGLCYSCTMVIDGVPNTRSCQTLVKRGLRVEAQKGLQKFKAGKWNPQN